MQKLISQITRGLALRVNPIPSRRFVFSTYIRLIIWSAEIFTQNCWSLFVIKTRGPASQNRATFLGMQNDFPNRQRRLMRETPFTGFISSQLPCPAYSAFSLFMHTPHDDIWLVSIATETARPAQCWRAHSPSSGFWLVWWSFQSSPLLSPPHWLPSVSATKSSCTVPRWVSPNCSYILHRETLDSHDCVCLQLDHNASHACNHNALRHLTSRHSLTRNITSYNMKNLAFHSSLRWKMIVLPVSLPHLYISL